MFLQASVILSTGGWVSASVHVGIPDTLQSRHPPKQTPLSRHPPGADTPWEQTPPRADTPLGADTPRVDTPPEWTCPVSRPPSLVQTTPRGIHTPPWNRHSHPPQQTTPPKRSRLQHTVNEQSVCILLECILVKVWFPSGFEYKYIQTYWVSFGKKICHFKYTPNKNAFQ